MSLFNPCYLRKNLPIALLIKNNKPSSGNTSSIKKTALPPSKARLKWYARLYDFAFILLSLITVFIAVSLLAHHSSDDIWRHSNQVTEFENIGGWIGAGIAEFLFAWFGWAAYFVPMLTGLLTWYSYLGFKKHKFNPLRGVILRIVGFVFLLVLLAGFIASNTSGQEAGGWVGLFINDSLSRAFGGLVNLFYVGLFMVSFSLTGHLSWLNLFDKTGRIVAGFFARLYYGLSDYFANRQLIKEQQKDASYAKKEREVLVRNRQKYIREQDKPLEIKEKVIEVKPSVVSKQGRQKSMFSDAISPLPSLSLLDPVIQTAPGYSTQTLENMSRQVEIKLKDFGISAVVEVVTPGPVITQFELSLAPGIKVSKIVGLSKDLARALLVDGVRVLETIAGKDLIGLEIPNTKREMIGFKQMLSSEVFELSKSPLTVTLGKDTNGNPVIADLAKMPHLLVAGATGMGKSVGLNTMILSILYKSNPDAVRMIMIDPKVVELASYADIPHLLTPVITDMNEAAGALRWSVAEMERRYTLLAKFGVRNIDGINGKIEAGIKNKKPLLDPAFDLATADEGEVAQPLNKLPLIIVVIDEYADMLGALAQEDRTKAKRVEALIIRIAQKARAAGIHLVIATQRPSVDVITGLIKSNVPSRIAFRVSSKIDSRTILDKGGAEELLGMGDMLYMTTGQSQLRRIHGAFVSDDEVNRVCQYLRDNSTPNYIPEILTSIGDDEQESGGTQESGSSSAGGGEQDAMYDEAVDIVTKTRRASISGLQRKLRIGYNRAARIIEDMEAAGLVSAMNSNGNREILVPNPNER